MLKTKAVIMAGGKGSRIRTVENAVPKPMIPVQGKPVLEHEIECLRSQGITDIIITVCHMAQVIIDYFGDGSGRSLVTDEPFGVHISYYVEEQPIGNAGALFKIRDQLSEDFLLLNADSIFDVDFSKFVNFHKSKGGIATLFTHPNDHPYDSGLVITDDDCSVERWLTKEDIRPDFYKNRVNAGLHVLSKEILSGRNLGDGEKVDLDRHLLKPLAGTGKLFAYDSPEYVRDMGTPERYRAVSEDFVAGIVRSRNLSNKQKAIFLDRDGTINVYKGFLRDIMDFELCEGVAESVRKINRSGYLAIVVTNQPVIARGELTEEELEEIHNKMETILGREGAYLDAIYYCPHHPDKGFKGEVSAMKIICDCRKPKPGMLLRAGMEFNIDLSQSYMIGDSVNDMKAGESVGCRCLRIGNGAFKDLRSAVESILEGKNE